MNTVKEVTEILDGQTQEAILTLLDMKFRGFTVFSTSFGWEDQAISHMIFSNDLPIQVFTLDTGRLFPETYYVWNRTLEIYNKNIHAYYPDRNSVEALLSEKGHNSFYESVENR